MAKCKASTGSAVKGLILQRISDVTALIMMLMPRLRNGFEKSMTSSRSAVMVSGAIARSANCMHAHTHAEHAAFSSRLLTASQQREADI